MEITDFKDFYIDLNGDVKASTGDNNFAKFLTTTEKLNSQYYLIDNIDDLQSRVQDINAMFNILDKPVFKQYAIKTDEHENIVGIKIYADYLNNDDNLNFVIIGYDITSLGFDVDYYFTGSVTAVNDLIKKYNLTYEIKEFETHAPFLFSIKKDNEDNVINFKTYYGLKENISFYSESMIPGIKNAFLFRK